jgi:hypothetical protein
LNRNQVSPATPAPPSNPVPDPSRDAIPEGIAALLRVVRILLSYGRHLADTVSDRAAAPSFPAIAACFGTFDVSVILARLHRGIMRAVALERVLLARAVRGRDIAFVRSRSRPRQSKAAPAGPAENRPSAANKPAPRPPRRAPADPDTLTLEELELHVRRRPIGRTIADICLDLAVVPGFCTSTFWNELFDATHWSGGSIATMLRERYRREQEFHREQDRRPTQGWVFPDQRRETARQVLGFFIGEQPMLPSSMSPIIAPAAAAATGPP